MQTDGEYLDTLDLEHGYIEAHGHVGIVESSIEATQVNAMKSS